MVSITSSIWPLSICLARLSVKSLGRRTQDVGGQSESVAVHHHVHHDGPAGVGERRLQGVASPGSSTRIPRAPSAAATWLKSGFTKSVPNGTKPASCCSRTKSGRLLLKMGPPRGRQHQLNSLLKRGASRLLREPLAGTTVQTTPGTSGHLPAWFSQFKCMNRPGKPGAILAPFRLTSEKPVVRTHLRPPSLCS